MAKVAPAKIRKQTGYTSPKIYRIIPTLKNSHYNVLNIRISGEAPKDFICIYEHGCCVKAKPRTWIKYIAKVGHKWYPIESITEHLLNRIGEVVGLNVASSKLLFVGGQLRFLSKYFLQPNQRLMHGAEIFSAYLEDDSFVENVSIRKIEQNFFTFQFAKTAIQHLFAQHAPEISLQFVRMLVFDAITGNFDRHMYNWGIVIDTDNRQPPYFSPIYDTARGFFWNYSEEQLTKWVKYRQLQEQVEKYAKDSKPKITWENQPKINHFDFIEELYCDQTEFNDAIKMMISFENRDRILTLLDDEFRYLLSPVRLEAIKLTIHLRFEQLTKKIRLWES